MIQFSCFSFMRVQAHCHIVRTTLSLCSVSLFLLSGGHLAAGSRFRAAEDPPGNRRLDPSGSGAAAETRGDRKPAQCNAAR